MISSMFLSLGAPVVEKISEHFASLNKAIAAMNFGRHDFPVALLASPEQRYAARAASQEALTKLARSVCSTMSVHDNSVFVFFADHVDDIPSKRGFNFRRWLSAQDTSNLDGFFAIIGDHTQLVVKSLHEDFPNNQLWRTIRGQLLICTRTEDNYDILKSWGVADNQKGEARAVTTFRDKLLSIHNDIVAMSSRVDSGQLTKKMAKTNLQQLKANRGLEYNLNANSMGQLWGIAQRTGAVWDALKKITEGKVHHANPKKRFIPPISAAPFTQMGGIPDRDLVVLLGNVVNGTYTLKMIAESCKRWKATARVQKEILAHQDIKMTDWLEAQKKFQTACDPHFVASWVQVILTAKILARSPMPGDFHRSLSRKVNFDLNRAENQAQIDQVGLLSINLLLVHMNINCTFY